MDPQPTQAEQDAADATRRQAQSLVLRDLIQVSAGLARLLAQQVAEQLAAVARGEAKAGTLPDLIIRYDRLSRSIERNFLMGRRLAEPPRRPAAAPPAPAPRRDAPRPAKMAREATASPAPGIPRAEPAPAAPLQLAELQARLTRDLAARAAATLPYPPAAPPIPPRRTGTGPP